MAITQYNIQLCNPAVPTRTCRCMPSLVFHICTKCLCLINVIQTADSNDTTVDVNAYFFSLLISLSLMTACEGKQKKIVLFIFLMNFTGMFFMVHSLFPCSILCLCAY